MKQFQWSGTIVAVLSLAGMITAAHAAETGGIALSGDFRYRHETIDTQGGDMRNRQRIRARLKAVSDVSDNISVGMQLTTGGDNPISGNQTLTGGFTSKQLTLDQAYFSWNVAEVPGFGIRGGKMKNPHVQPGGSELMWDSDLNPEGVAASFAHDLTENAGMFLNAGYYWIEERKTANDTVILGGQAGIEYTLGRGDILFGAGYFDYQQTRGMTPFYTPADGAGNTLAANGTYLYDYDELELFAEYSTPEILKGVTLYADYVGNIAEDVGDNSAWLAGVSAGKLDAPGSFACNLSYRHLEADAVIGAFTDSDFLGGGTNGRGFEVNVDYRLAVNTVATATWFANRAGIDNGRDYSRMQIDVKYSYK